MVKSTSAWRSNLAAKSPPNPQPTITTRSRLVRRVAAMKPESGGGLALASLPYREFSVFLASIVHLTFGPYVGHESLSLFRLRQLVCATVATGLGGDAARG